MVPVPRSLEEQARSGLVWAFPAYGTGRPPVGADLRRDVQVADALERMHCWDYADYDLRFGATEGWSWGLSRPDPGLPAEVQRSLRKVYPDR